MKAGGYTYRFTLPAAGRLRVAWYSAPRAGRFATARRKPVLVARGRATFTAAGTRKLTVRLTARGRRLLKRVRRKRTKRPKLIAEGSFTPAGTPTAIIASRRFKPRR